MTQTERTKILNHPERSVPDETAEIIAAGSVAHVGFIQDGLPFVIPLSYHYDESDPTRMYLHGSIRSRAMEQTATGIPLCITVTLIDGLVYSRKAMNHSINYRSAVVFGTGREITDEQEKFDLFDKMVQRYFPERTVGEDYVAPPSADLGVTALVEVQIDEWSGKARRGGPTGPDDDNPNAAGTAGTVDLREA